mgnify:FL=1
MRFTVEDLANYGGVVLKKYPILEKYKPVIDYPYKNRKIDRLTIEISCLNDLIDLKEELDEEILLKDDYETNLYKNEKERLFMLEISY